MKGAVCPPAWVGGGPPTAITSVLYLPDLAVSTCALSGKLFLQPFGSMRDAEASLCFWKR